MGTHAYKVTIRPLTLMLYPYIAILGLEFFPLIINCLFSYSQIKQKMRELEPYKRSKKKVDGFPVEKVVKLTWKFVTTSKPIIVCQPMEFDSRIHNCEPECWNVKQQKPYQLFYVRPVVYRSYHGSVACKGLVGNVLKTV